MVHTKPTMNGTEPTVEQPPCNGWNLSWNPDDNRWYVEHPDTLEVVATRRERRNAVQYARNHQAGIS
jgi:hypothetical protein